MQIRAIQACDGVSSQQRDLHQITGAAEEQRAVSEDISKNTQAINDVSDSLAGQTQNVSDNAEQILVTSGALSSRVNQFKI